MIGYNVTLIGDCSLSGNGSIELFPTGGTAPYTVDWYNPDLGTDTTILAGEFSMRDSLGAGLYQILITDSSTPPNNYLYVNLYVSSGVCATLEVITNTTCGLDNGILEVNSTTLNYPVTYVLYLMDGIYYDLVTTAISNNIQTFDSLPPGIYFVEATDSGGCVGTTGTCVIEDSTELDFGLYIVDNSSCGVTYTGALYITGLTGTAPYTYLWSNGTYDTYISGVTDDTYSVTITDAAGCVKTKSGTVVTVAPLGIVNFVNTSPTCFASNGQIIVNISGGTAPYYYNFSNGDNQITGDDYIIYSDLVAGTYTVIVTDATFCVVSGSTTILPPDTFTSVSVDVGNSICAYNQGYITITGIGGYPPYDVTLKDYNGNIISTATASPSWTFDNLGEGVYTVELTTQNGDCTYDETVTVLNAQAFNVTATPTASSCGGANGSVLITVDTPGTYIYQVGNTTIYNLTSTAQTFSNLSSGYYVAKVKDINPFPYNCEIEVPFIIDNSEKVTFTLGSTTCGTGSGGTVTALITGGVPPYTFDWGSNVGGQTGVFLTGLTAGTYTLLLTDSSGCTAQKSITVVCDTIYSAYIPYSVCVSNFTEVSASELTLSKMLNDGYQLLTSGETGCFLSAATYNILIDVGGTGYTAELYTTNSLLDYPSVELYVQQLRDLLDTIPGIDSDLTKINVNSNTIQLTTECSKELAEKEISIRISIDYILCCNP